MGAKARWITAMDSTHAVKTARPQALLLVDMLFSWPVFYSETVLFCYAASMFNELYCHCQDKLKIDFAGA
jgi:hypothetical protein